MSQNIWETVRNGELLQETLIVDCHAHLGPWYNFHIPGDPWEEGILAAMDTCGIDQVILSPMVAIGPDAVLGNEFAREAAGRFPGRVYAYCTVNPNYPEEEMLGELERCFENSAFRAIKIHPATHDYAADGPNYRLAWDFANQHHLPVLVHTWGGDPKCGPLLFENLGREYPNARILLGHCGASIQGIRESLQVAERTENLILDLTKSFMHQGLLEEMVRAVGPDRVLFGTDIPFIDCRPQIGYVASGKISDAAKERIFGLNAVELFGLNPPN